MKRSFLKLLVCAAVSCGALPASRAAGRPASAGGEAGRRLSFRDRLEYAGVAVQEKGWNIWGTSPIAGDDGKIHLFVSRWPAFAPGGRRIPFDPDGWRQYSQIAHYVGDGPTGPFVFSDVALEGTGADTWDRYAPGNSLIKKVDGKYVLIYIANPVGMTKGARAHPPTQRIGMATSLSLYGPWKRVGKDGMILAPSGEKGHWTHRSDCGVNNPAFLKHPDGRYFLYFKSSGGRMGLAIAERLEGPYVHQPGPVTANKYGIEDGYAFLMDGKIRLLTTDNHGILKRGGGLLWTSGDGLKFDPDPAPGFGLLREHIPAGRITDFRRYYGPGDKFERPQILLIGGEPAYLFAPAGSNIGGGDGTVSHVLRIRPAHPAPGEGGRK